MRYTFTVVYVRGRDGAVLAYIAELPGAHAQGRTVEEAARHLLDAAQLTLRANVRRNSSLFSGLLVIKRAVIGLEAEPIRQNRGDDA